MPKLALFLQTLIASTIILLAQSSALWANSEPVANAVMAANGKWVIIESKEDTNASIQTKQQDVEPSVESIAAVVADPSSKVKAAGSIQLYTFNAGIPLSPLGAERANDVIVIGRNAGWVEVRVQDGVLAWVNKSAVRQLSNGSIEVTRNKSKIYISPTPKSRYLVSLSLGYQSAVYASTGDWLQVRAPSWVKYKMKASDVGPSKLVKEQIKANQPIKTVEPVIAQQPVEVVKPIQSVSVSNVAGVELVTEAPSSMPVPKAVEPAPKNVVSTVTNVSDDGSIAYLLTPGDVISITVFGEPDMALSNQRIPENGLLSFPLIGQVQVKNKTAGAVEKLIESKLSSGYLRDPKVNLVIDSYRPLYVRGAVVNPGAYDYTEGLTVAKVLATAGGVTDQANRDTVKLSRNNALYLQNLTIDSQTLIRPGDILTVESTTQVKKEANQFVYLHGEVNKPGAYTFRQGLTVEKAVALAGGFSPRASKRKIRISREVPDQEKPEQLKKVPLYRDLQPGDVVNVGASLF